ncbi:MAG: ABC transporter ATP-binding protein [Peptococcaceae bacterium]|jgi:oligopeptide transport system ATP-binding protein|nr:ABC transporter ATP-binding protein [Peptococcaceae bacterium]
MSGLLTIENLDISFSVFAGEVKAVRGVSFRLDKGETLAIVGESGSGKSVTVKSIMRLLPNNAKINSGSILLDGEDLLRQNERETLKVRGQRIGMIFQDPMTALDPTMNIGDQVMESLLLHKRISRREAGKKALELLELVGITTAGKRMRHFPHQFSGGQRQRIVIAIALICSPEIIIADEPTTALDVTVQAQILELLKEIQKQLATAVIFITHDLGVVANIADRVAVMYAGKIVEIGKVDEILLNSRHPYTWGLLSAMPSHNADEKRIYTIPGTPPDMLCPPQGDAFYPRNKYALKIDTLRMPPFFQVSPTHQAATWLLAPGAPEVTPPAEIIAGRELFRERARNAR